MSRTPNMQQVAEAAGVSKSAVSLALRDDPRLALETRRRVQEIASRLGYRKNPVVASLMAQLRASQTPKFQANFALINCSNNRTLFDLPSYAEVRRGIRELADQQGYGVEEFWADEPGVPLGRLREILHTRNIKGIIVATSLDARPLFLGHVEYFHEFCFSAVGADRTDPILPRAINHHYRTARGAVEAAYRHGYRRPGLAVSERVDRFLERRFSSGFAAGVQDGPASEAASRTAPLLFDGVDRTLFARWLKAEKPDVIVTDLAIVMDWLQELKIPVPRSMGLIHLDWTQQMRDWAGMQQNSRLVGAAAADLLVQQLTNNGTGIPDHPKLVMIESDFVPGPSLKEKTTADGQPTAEARKRMPLRSITERVVPAIPR